MQDGTAISAEEAGEWLRENAKDSPTVIPLTRPANGRPASTLTIHRRPWTAEERRQLARILFGPSPGDTGPQTADVR